MDEEFKFEGSITFGNVMEMYKKIISVGFRPFNIYGLFAENFEQGINLGADFHFKEMNYWVSVSDDNKESDLVKKLQKEQERFCRDITDSQSNDLIVANSPKVRYHQDIGKWSIENIASEEIDSMNMYKQANYIPLIGERFYVQLPFVRDRDISIDRKDGVYSVRLRIDTKRELDTVQRLFYELVSPATE